MPAPTYYVIFNEKSGTALSLGLSKELLADKFRQNGVDAVVDANDELDRKLDRAIRSDASVVVAAGGDGTATAVARRLTGTNKTLAILPLGTANLLARDL